MLKNRLKGFSLLELLLVVAVIAAISVAGVSYLKERALNVKIDKTALQMQQWLQAAASYRIDNSKWPQDIKDLLPDNCQTPTRKYYMPCGSEVSPWSVSSADGLYAIEPDPQFQGSKISLTILDTSVGSGSLPIAQRIAGKLAIAKVETVTGGSKVSATITDRDLPGQTGDVLIKGIYERVIGDGKSMIDVPCDDKNRILSKAIPKPKDCSANYEPRLFLYLKGFNEPYHTSKQPSYLDNVNIGYVDVDDKTWKAYIVVKGFTIDMKICSYNGTVIAITACVKTNYDP